MSTRLTASWVRGNLHLAAKPQATLTELQEEARAPRGPVWVPAGVTYLSRQAVAERTSAGRDFMALCWTMAARHLHPLKYALGLAPPLPADAGVRMLREAAAALSYTEADSRVTLKTEHRGLVKARFTWCSACNAYLGKADAAHCRQHHADQ